MSGRKMTFLLITIPIVALFFCFNTLPLIKGVIYSFTNFKGDGSFDWVGLRNYQDLFTDSRVGGYCVKCKLTRFCGWGYNKTNCASKRKYIF